MGSEPRLKVLYMTIPPYFDLEISLIRELSALCDVKVILFLTEKSMRSSAFSLSALDPRCALIPASEYPGMEKYANLIDLNNWIIANNPHNSVKDALKLTLKIQKYAHRFHPDMVHYTSFNYNIAGSIFLFRHRVQSLFTLHDPVPHGHRGRKDRFLTWNMQKSCPNFLLLSDPPLNNPRCLVSPDKRIFRSQLGVYDFLASYPPHPIARELPEKYILFFGRVEPYKGVDFLIDCYTKTQAAKQGYKLVIAGKGTIKDHDKELITDYNRYIENDELAELIRRSALIILPYISATQSGVLMSAFALNKPVLATDTGNFKEVLCDGKYGITVPPLDEEAMVAAIDATLADSEGMQRMSANIDRDFQGDGGNGWKAIAANLLKSYKKIIASR